MKFNLTRFAMFLFLLLFGISAAPAQFKTGLITKLTPPDAPRSKVLLLGVFHLKDAGADDYQKKYVVDVMSLSRQKEIDELLKALAKFQPTKIAVEWSAEQQAQLDDAFQK